MKHKQIKIRRAYNCNLTCRTTYSSLIPSYSYIVWYSLEYSVYSTIDDIWNTLLEIKNIFPPTINFLCACTVDEYIADDCVHRQGI